MKRYLVILIALVLLVAAALLVFSGKAANPVQNPEPDVTKPAVTTPAIPVPDSPKVVDVPVKEEPTVVAGPQAGDPVLLVPHELWQYAVKTLDGGIGFNFPPSVEKIAITLPIDVYVIPELGLIQFPVTANGDRMETFEMIKLSPSKSMKDTPVDLAIIITERVKGRINYPVDGDQPIITLHPGERKAFYRGRGYDLLTDLPADVDLPDEVKKETDPYRHFKKVFEWWVKEYRK